jgi:hypothetical protein
MATSGEPHGHHRGDLTTIPGEISMAIDRRMKVGQALRPGGAFACQRTHSPACCPRPGNRSTAPAARREGVSQLAELER